MTWTNLDSSPHTATSGISPNFDGAFDSSSLSQNGTFSHTFNSTGASPYFCTIHPSMTATITVQEAAGAGLHAGTFITCILRRA